MIPVLVGSLCILLSQTPAGTHLAYAVSSELAEHKPAVESYPKPSIDSANAASTLARTMAELEHSAAFRKAAKDAWRAARNGDAPFETGFAIDPDGRP